MKKYLIILLIVCVLAVIPFVSQASIFDGIKLWFQDAGKQIVLFLNWNTSPKLPGVPDFVAKMCEENKYLSVRRCDKMYVAEADNLMDGASSLYDNNGKYLGYCGGELTPNGPADSTPDCKNIKNCAKEDLCKIWENSAWQTGTIKSCKDVYGVGPGSTCGYCFVADDVTKSTVIPETMATKTFIYNYLNEKVKVKLVKSTGPVNIMCPVNFEIKEIQVLIPYGNDGLGE